MLYYNCLPCSRGFVVDCMEFDWVMCCGLGWFVGSNFYFAMGWVGSVVWWIGLGWVEEIGSNDNSDVDRRRLR